MTREEAREKWEVIKAYGEGFDLPIKEKLRIKPKEIEK